MSESGFAGLSAGEVSAKSKKRKTKEINLPLSRRKRIKSFYNDKYRDLYNSVLAGHFHSPAAGDSQYLSPSQIGSTKWTTTEKNTFFHVIARKGRLNLKAIAVELPCKSEPEIAQYIELLASGLVNAKRSSKPPLSLKRSELESALEIGPECMVSLDRAGAALSICQQTLDEKLEKENQGEMWLLTPRIGHWVERCLQESKDNENDISQLVPEAVLLNLKNCLRLSKCFFMNSNDSEYNWTSYADKSEKPAIMHSAFVDLHNLAVYTITRLVQSTMHFAISRSRAEQHSSEPYQRFVTEKDVATALSVLDMKASMKSYWAGVPRRCNLLVSKNWQEAHAPGNSYSYDELEDLLGVSQRAQEGQGLSMTLAHDEAIDDVRVATSDSECDIAGIFDSCDSSHLSSLDGESCSEEEQEQQNDASLELLDRSNSQAEERRLWELLEESPVSKADVFDGKDTNDLKSSSTIRRDRADLVDWTSWIDYGAEWESIEHPVAVEHFRQKERN